MPMKLRLKSKKQSKDLLMNMFFIFFFIDQFANGLFRREASYSTTSAFGF
jgi:hypothetical protein